MTNHCTHEQSQAMKEIGFDMPVRDYYNEEGQIDTLGSYYNWNTTELDEASVPTTSAPTHAEALVEEAIEKLRMVGGINPDQRPYCMKILTDLAKKSAEIGDVDQPALQPLPEEIPKLLLNDLDPYRFWDESENRFNYHFSDIKKLYNLFRKHFGTPSNNLQPLPEKMPEWFMDQFLQQSALENWNKVRQHFGTPPRAWWMDLKKGDKFMYLKNTYELDAILLRSEEDYSFYIEDCSPYTDPEAEFIATLTPEQLAMYKKVKEGKG